MNQEGTQLDLRKIKDVTNFPVPILVINVRAFLGLTSYYRNYVESYFHIAIPLFDLIKNNTTFK